METNRPSTIPINPPSATITAPSGPNVNALKPMATLNIFNKNPKPTPTKAPTKMALQEIRLE